MSTVTGREITKIALTVLLVAGGVVAFAVAPGIAGFLKILKASHKLPRREKQKIYNRFYYLRKNGFINIDYKGRQMYISLTKEGRKKAGKFQIDDLQIRKQKKWDGKWWLLMFDIKKEEKVKREALRGKLKELGLYQFQKSVWVYPYSFQKEMQLLRDFFRLSKKEMTIIKAIEIERNQELKTFFCL